MGQLSLYDLDFCYDQCLEFNKTILCKNLKSQAHNEAIFFEFEIQF